MKQKILSFNLEDSIIHHWQKVSTLSKRALWWIFLITNIVFLFHSVTFLLGDHDYGWRLIEGVRPDARAGRFFADWPLLLFGKDILPIFNNLFSFLGFSLAVIYLAKYWDIPKTIFSYIAFGLFIILMPYTLTWMWFVSQTSNFWILFLVFYGLYQVQSGKWWHYTILGAFIFIAMGVYQSVLSTVLIAFLGKCLLDLVTENLSFKQLIKKHYKVGLVISIAFLVYLACFLPLKYIGVTEKSDYHAQFVSAANLKEQIVKTLLSIRDEFWLASSYMPKLFKRILLIPIVLSLFFCFFRKNLKTIILVLLIICSILLSSQITPFLSGGMKLFRTMRIDFFAFPYIYALACTILLKRGISPLKSLTLGIMIISIFFSTLGDIRCQKVWHLARQAEFNFWQEAMTRIHALPNFHSSQQYRLITFGEISTQQYFDKYNKKVKKQYEFTRSFAHKDRLEMFFDFIERREFISTFIRYHRLSNKQLLSLDQDYILNRAKPWPHKDSIAIIGDTIYIVLEQKALEQFQRQLRKVLPDPKESLNK